MSVVKRLWVIVLVLGLISWLLVAIWPVSAQQPAGQIVITGSDDSSAPTVRLHLYAVDGQGNAVTLDEGSLIVRHDGVEVSDFSIATPYQAGTFTLFIVDVPDSVATYIPTIQEAIQQYASEPTMLEQVDYVAIFAVDELAATQIMGSDTFHNSITNAFSSPLAPRSGATALIDSVMGLLNNLDTLKPNPEITTHVVLMSDGTDVVSTQFEAGNILSRASELGIPVHTVLLDNQSLPAGDKASGQAYMAQIASGTQAISTTLATAADLQPIWDRISSFREQTTVQYTPTDSSGGDHSVEVSLRNNPAATAATTVTFPPGAPSVTIDLPAESRTLTLPNLDQPVSLSLAASVAWLDSAERKVETAQLLVNGIIIQEIDASNLDRFDVAISNLRYGSNQLQVAVVDDQGGRATSPEISLIIDQGELEIPEEVAPSGLLDRIWARISGAAIFVGGCFLIIFLLVLIIGITVAARKSPIVRRLRLDSLMRRIPFLRTYFQDVYQVQGQARRAQQHQRRMSRYTGDVKGAGQKVKGSGGTRPAAFLELLESNTQMSGRIELEALESRLGRSASQADIVFKDDNTVSRIHATIVKEGENYRLFDEQSTSGTWVNEQRVPDYGLQLVDGDTIRLGAVRLRFRQP